MIWKLIMIKVKLTTRRSQHSTMSVSLGFVITVSKKGLNLIHCLQVSYLFPCIFRNCNHAIYNSPKTQGAHVTKWVFVKLFIGRIVKAQNATEKDMKMGKHVFSMHVDVPSSLAQLEQFSEVRGRWGKALGTAGLTDSWAAWLFCIFICQLPEIKARRCVPGAHAGPGK